MLIDEQKTSFVGTPSSMQTLAQRGATFLGAVQRTCTRRQRNCLVYRKTSRSGLAMITQHVLHGAKPFPG